MQRDRLCGIFLAKVKSELTGGVVWPRAELSLGLACAHGRGPRPGTRAVPCFFSPYARRMWFSMSEPALGDASRRRESGSARRLRCWSGLRWDVDGEWRLGPRNTCPERSRWYAVPKFAPQSRRRLDAFHGVVHTSGVAHPDEATSSPLLRVANAATDPGETRARRDCHRPRLVLVAGKRVRYSRPCFAGHDSTAPVLVHRCILQMIPLGRGRSSPHESGQSRPRKRCGDVRPLQPKPSDEFLPLAASTGHMSAFSVQGCLGSHNLDQPSSTKRVARQEQRAEPGWPI